MHISHNLVLEEFIQKKRKEKQNEWSFDLTHLITYVGLFSRIVTAATWPLTKNTFSRTWSTHRHLRYRFSNPFKRHLQKCVFDYQTALHPQLSFCSHSPCSYLFHVRFSLKIEKCRLGPLCLVGWPWCIFPKEMCVDHNALFHVHSTAISRLPKGALSIN